MISDATNDAEAPGVWSILARLYQKRDGILESSNRIVRYADELDSIATDEAFEQAQAGTFDSTDLNRTLSSIQIELNSILSYSHELLPHIKNASLVSILSGEALMLLAKMRFSTGALLIGLGVISIELRVFAQSCNRLVLNPTKKSFKAAFGVNIGNELAGIRAQLEARERNY